VKLFTLLLWGVLTVTMAATFSAAFTDEAMRAGLTAVFVCGDDQRKNYIIETLGTGVALFDYNNDGLLDIFAVTASRLDGFPKGQEPSNRLYQNKGDGTFVDVSRASGLARSGWGQGVCSADFDNDGNQDLFVTYYGRDILYRNKGNGSFEDITTSSGLASQADRWGTGCAFVDYNRDGKLDLFVANYVQFDQKNTPTPDSPKACTWKGDKVMCGPRGLKGGVNRLFRNDSAKGSVKFTDVSDPSGIEGPGERYSLSVTTLDFDVDQWPDIYVAVDSQASLLFRNNRDGTFSEVAVETGVAYSEDGREQAGMGSAVIDFDGDGRADLAKTNFSEDTPNLYRNNGDGTFAEATFQAGLGIHSQFLGWGVASLDYDRDTWPDIFMVNGHVYPGHKHVSYRQRRILYRNVRMGNSKTFWLKRDLQSWPKPPQEASR
jgi:enediyne biosynthesis protein E4